MNSELEAEGFARELSRKIQEERNNAGLIKKDAVDLVIKSDDLDLLKRIKKDWIIDKVNAKKYSLEKIDKKEKGYSYVSEFNIKNKKFEIAFNKV